MGGLSGHQIRLLILLTASQAIAYSDRVNLSVVVPDLIRNHGYTPVSAGVLLSLFNWSYMAAILLAGPLTDHFKPRRIYPFAVALWSAATCLCGTTAQFLPLALCRVGVGLAEAPMIPAGTRVIRETFPQRIWASTISIFFAGNKLGLALGIPLSAFLLSTFGREWVFYVTGVTGLIWIAFWLPTYRGSVVAPEREERGAGERLAWAALLRHRTTWGIMLGQGGYLYVYFVFATWLPGYLVLQRQMPTMQSGALAMLPFVVGIGMTIFGGWLSDRLVTRGRSVTFARKSLAVGGIFGATLFVVAGALVANAFAAVAFFALALGSLSLASATVNTMAVDVAPPHLVASFSSLQAFGGNLGGALAPLMTGVLVSATGGFLAPLLFTAAVGIIFGCGGFGLIVADLDHRLDVPAAKTAAAYQAG